jgi:hypothetical protein
MRHIDQWNRLEDLCSYSHLILGKVAKTCAGKKAVSLANDFGETGYPLKLDPYFSPYTKVNSK